MGVGGIRCKGKQISNAPNMCLNIMVTSPFTRVEGSLRGSDA